MIGRKRSCVVVIIEVLLSDAMVLQSELGSGSKSDVCGRKTCRRWPGYAEWMGGLPVGGWVVLGGEAR